MDTGQAQISPAKVDVASRNRAGGGSGQVAERDVYDVSGADAAGESLLGRGITWPLV